MVMDVSERRVCRVAGQHRSTQRRPAPPNPYRDRLVGRMRELAVANPRRGRRYIIDLLRKGRWSVGARLMKRLWRQEGLLVPGKRMKRRRIGTGENGIVRRRATRRNEVWGMDFVQDWTADGRPLRMLVVLDEYTRECLAIEVRRRLRGKDVVAVLDELTMDSPANATSARGSPADERLVSRVFRVFVSRPRKALSRLAGYPPPEWRVSRLGADRLPSRPSRALMPHVRHHSELVDVDHGQVVYPSLEDVALVCAHHAHPLPCRGDRAAMREDVYSRTARRRARRVFLMSARAARPSSR